MAELKIKADSGGGTVSFKGPATTTSNAAVQLTLPVDDGAADQYLQTNGSGVLSWATVSSTPEGTAIKSTGETGTSKFLRIDGDNTCSWQTVPAATTTSGTDNFTIADGNLVIGTSGHGIDFSATADTAATNASMGNELLDDYEYGTWTPDMDNGTYTSSNPNIVATYVKIGHFVFANAAFKNVSQFTATANSTHFHDVPFNSTDQHAGSAVQANIGDLGSVCVNGSTWYLPAVNYDNNVTFTCVYNI